MCTHREAVWETVIGNSAFMSVFLKRAVIQLAYEKYNSNITV